MNKTDITLGMRVKVSARGKGTVVDLMPTTKFFVKVEYDLGQGKFSGMEMNADVDTIKPLPPPKPTRIEKYHAQVNAVRQSPFAYYVAGWLLTHDSNYNASAPEGEQTDSALEELAAVGMDVLTDGSDVTVTHGRNLAQGRSYSVTTEDFGDYVSDSLAAATSVLTPYRGLGTPIRGIQAKQFVLDFLGGDLNFKLDKTQDVARILSRVPAAFRSAFEQGMRGEKIEKENATAASIG